MNERKERVSDERVTNFTFDMSDPVKLYELTIDLLHDRQEARAHVTPHKVVSLASETEDEVRKADKPPARKAVIEYVVNDGESPPETHRQLVPHDTTVWELVEFLEDRIHIVDSSLVLKAALDWEE